jgi:hypothetical protein
MEDLHVDDMILGEESCEQPRLATDAHQASCEEVAQWEDYPPEEEMIWGEERAAKPKVCIL